MKKIFEAEIFKILPLSLNAAFIHAESFQNLEKDTRVFFLQVVVLEILPTEPTSWALNRRSLDDEGVTEVFRKLLQPIYQAAVLQQHAERKLFHEWLEHESFESKLTEGPCNHLGRMEIQWADWIERDHCQVDLMEVDFFNHALTEHRFITDINNQKINIRSHFPPGLRQIG